MSEGELLDWLCWVWAIEGWMAYPQGDVEAVGAERKYETWCTAVERFDQLRRRGFDPKARAKRHFQRCGNGDDTLWDDVDWEWYQRHSIFSDPLENDP